MHELHTRRRVEFADTDMAGIVHFARFFVFMETAEHEYLRALGIPVHFVHEGQEIGWPRAAAACSYSSPARLGDEIDIHVRVKRKGRKSMTYGFRFSCGGHLVAEGETTTVCCTLHPGRAVEATRIRAIPIPSFLAEQIEEAPGEVSRPREEAGRGGA